MYYAKNLSLKHVVKKYTVRDITSIEQSKKHQTARLTILADEEVYLYEENSRKTKLTLRLVKAVRRDTGNSI